MRVPVLAVVLMSVGCLTPVDTELGTYDGGGDPMCPSGNGSGLTYISADPYPFCQWDGPSGYQNYCPRQGGEWGYMNWHTEAGSAALCQNAAPYCNTCLCFQRCSVTATPGGTCLAPSSGTATPACVGDANRGVCYLFCDGGGTCPDGMRCVLTPAEETNGVAGHKVCAWAVWNQRCSP